MGLRGILVLTGKTTKDEAIAAGVPGNEISASLRDVVDAVGSGG